MKFTLLAIGKIKEKWMRQGIEEYVKRLKPIAPLEIIAQDEEKNAGESLSCYEGKSDGEGRGEDAEVSLAG